MAYKDPNQAPVVKISRKNVALVTCIQRLENQTMVIVRGFGDKQQRVLDPNINPLATISTRDLDLLVRTGILVYKGEARGMAYSDLYAYNNQIKVEAA